MLRLLGFQPVAWLWVASAIYGWWPKTSPLEAQRAWFVLASILVIAVGMRQPVKRHAPVFGWVVAGCLFVFLSHITSVGWGLIWVLQVTVILTAAHLLAERGEWRWLRQAVIRCAWAQLPIALCAHAGIAEPWTSAGNGLTGSLEKRAALGLLWGIASLWSSGWRSRLFALLSCLTGSLMGLPTLWRLWGQSRFKPWPAILVGWPAVLLLTHRLWWPRLMSRLDVFQSLHFLKDGWLTGWGFTPFPGGFRYAGLDFHGVTSDYHSAVVDWIARTGLIGTVLMGCLVVWVWRRATTSMMRWTLGFAAWAACLQSLEAFPIMGMLGLVMLIMFTQEVRHPISPLPPLAV